MPSAYLTNEPGKANFIVTTKEGRREVEVPHVNAYSEQADDLARAIIEGAPLKFEAADSIKNMRVIDACLQSARERTRIII
ncbi:hypothetical protein D3C80_1744180 [compost metagenome]